MENSPMADILKKGKVDAQVSVGGMLQKHTLKVEEEKTAFGKISVLKTEAKISATEAIRLAGEYGLPIRAPLGLVFPRGKGPADFLVK